MITGIVLGVLGLIGAGLGLSKRRRARKAGEAISKAVEAAGKAPPLEDTIRRKRSK